MVKRCCWGTGNSDYRYPERLKGAFFYSFSEAKICLGLQAVEVVSVWPTTQTAKLFGKLRPFYARDIKCFIDL